MKLISHRDRKHRDSFIQNLTARIILPAWAGDGCALTLLLFHWRSRFISLGENKQENPAISQLLLTAPAKAEALSLCYLLELVQTWNISLTFAEKQTQRTTFLAIGNLSPPQENLEGGKQPMFSQPDTTLLFSMGLERA